MQKRGSALTLSRFRYIGFRCGLLQAVFVGLDHLTDHLAADGAGLLAGQVAVVALLQTDADLP